MCIFKLSNTSAKNRANTKLYKGVYRNTLTEWIPLTVVYLYAVSDVEATSFFKNRYLGEDWKLDSIYEVPFNEIKSFSRSALRGL